MDGGKDIKMVDYDEREIGKSAIFAPAESSICSSAYFINLYRQDRNDGAMLKKFTKHLTIY